MSIDYDHFAAVDMRVGQITAVEDFPEARKPAWKLTIDFGEELGTKRSSAQITNYTREELEGRRDRRGGQLPAAADRPGALRGARAGRLRRGGPSDPARARHRRAARRADSLSRGSRRRRRASTLGVGVGRDRRERSGVGVAAGGALGAGVASGVCDGVRLRLRARLGGRDREHRAGAAAGAAAAGRRCRCRSRRCRACPSGSAWCRRRGPRGGRGGRRRRSGGGRRGGRRRGGGRVALASAVSASAP